MSETTIDIPRLRKVVEWVEEQDKLPVGVSTWEQDEWVSTPVDYEKAVEALVELGQDGLTELGLRNAERFQHACGTAFCVAGKVVADEFGEKAICRSPLNLTVNGQSIPTLAAELLGLSQGQAYWLFAGDNTAADIRRIAEKFAGERL